jgi:hypothetical protein
MLVTIPFPCLQPERWEPFRPLCWRIWRLLCLQFVLRWLDNSQSHSCDNRWHHEIGSASLFYSVCPAVAQTSQNLSFVHSEVDQPLLGSLLWLNVTWCRFFCYWSIISLLCGGLISLLWLQVTSYLLLWHVLGLYSVLKWLKHRYSHSNHRFLHVKAGLY